MAKTALDLTLAERRAYRPADSMQHRQHAEWFKIEQRREEAWRVARQAAQMLKTEFGANKVYLFGSLLPDSLFTPWSDIDLAAQGISADRFFRAVSTVTGLSPVFAIDLVELETCPPSLEERIKQEGIEL